MVRQPLQRSGLQSCLFRRSFAPPHRAKLIQDKNSLPAFQPGSQSQMLRAESHWARPFPSPPSASAGRWAHGRRPALGCPCRVSGRCTLAAGALRCHDTAMLHALASRPCRTMGQTKEGLWTKATMHSNSTNIITAVSHRAKSPSSRSPQADSRLKPLTS